MRLPKPANLSFKRAYFDYKDLKSPETFRIDSMSARVTPGFSSLTRADFKLTISASKSAYLLEALLSLSSRF